MVKRKGVITFSLKSIFLVELFGDLGNWFEASVVGLTRVEAASAASDARVEGCRGSVLECVKDAAIGKLRVRQCHA